MHINKRPARLAFLLVPLLFVSLLSFDAETRWATADEAGKSAKSKAIDAEAIAKLIQQLGDDSLKSREEAIQRLIALGEAALPALQRTTDDRRADPDVRLRAARALRAIASIPIKQLRRLGLHEGAGFRWATRIVVTPDGRHAITAGCEALRCWDVKTGKQERIFGETKRPYWSLAVSPDGRRLLAGSADTNAYVFDVRTGKQLQRLIGHRGEVWGAAFLSDGKQAATGAWDGSIRVWDVASGKQLRAFKGVAGNVRCLALSLDGKLLASGNFAALNGPGTIHLWDVAKGTQVRALEGHKQEVTSVAFSADGKRLLSSSFDRTLRLWQVSDGKEVKRFVGHSGRIERGDFTADGRRIVSCGAEDDPTLRLWDVSSAKQLGEPERVAEGILCLAVLPERRCLTTGKDGAVRLWQWAR